MNKKRTSMPRFTAGASLYSINSRYHVHGMYQAAEHKVYLADYVDQVCLGECKQNCGTVCAGTSGSAKAACIHQCAADNAECNTICTRPGNPPTGGGGGGTGGGGSSCAPGTPCAGGCCPAGFPSCTSAAGSFWCCPSLFPNATVIFGQVVCTP